ncbi:MAG: hypothetical protein H0V01_03745 [Bacteroidetes bacterium]|nr:hypothetical protein [Bacteroidota bacterium]
MKLRIKPSEMKVLLSRKLEYFKQIITKNGIMAIPYVEFLIDIKNNEFKIALATGAKREKLKI